MATSFNAQGTHSVQLIVSVGLAAGRHSQICQSPAQIGLVLQALHGHVAQLASHANGTHVIQRCIQCYPPAHCAAFYQEIIDGCVDVTPFSSSHSQMSTHRHGCCVVQRFFTTVPPAFQQELADAIARHSRIIIPSPFGNYVVQVGEWVWDEAKHIMEHGSREQAVQLGRCVLGNVVLFCCQKYSSNVVEKAILLNDDERNRARYAAGGEPYGVFTLPDGARLRHHRLDYLLALTSRFRCSAPELTTHRTMNGHTSNGVHLAGRKID